jgi:hypothetical protein
MLSIYWGATWRVPEYTSNLNGYVVDLDGGPVGDAVKTAFQQASGTPTQLTWQFPPTSQFPNGVYGPKDTVEDAIVHERAWLAVVGEEHLYCFGQMSIWKTDAGPHQSMREQATLWRRRRRPRTAPMIPLLP